MTELRHVAACASLRLVAILTWIVLTLLWPTVASLLVPELAIAVIAVALRDQRRGRQRDRGR